MLVPHIVSTNPSRPTTNLSKCSPGEGWENKTSFVNVLAIVSAQLFLLLLTPAPDRFSDIAVCILAADHETYLPRGVRWNGRIGVFYNRKDFLACLLQLRNER
jgi:hypothetical protein